MDREDEFVEDVLWALNEIVDQATTDRVFYGWDSETPRFLTREGEEADRIVRQLLAKYNKPK